MLRFTIVALCLVAATLAQNQGRLSVNVQSGRGSSSGGGTSSQQRRGQNVRVGGSASSNGQADSRGGSSGGASASGFGQGGVSTANQQGEAVPQTDAERELARWVHPHGVVYPEIVSPGGTPPAQNPGVWEALDLLRGRGALISDEIQLILATAQPGKDYPILSDLPDTSFNCANVKQGGYYADTETRCQVFHRCDINGLETSYICPNQTVYNQITLVCDWFFNVDCAQSAQFYDYSNARLYHEDWPLLDTPAENAQSQNQQQGATNAGSRVRVQANRGGRADQSQSGQAQNY